ncbi:unnamed protein product [Polarella glacialis]|nr:unnamed protein product [Polarella glacialis]
MPMQGMMPMQQGGMPIQMAFMPGGPAGGQCFAPTAFMMAPQDQMPLNQQQQQYSEDVPPQF